MRKYKWLFFDLDNTIFDFTSASKIALEEIFIGFGLSDIQAAFIAYNEINSETWKQLELGVINAGELKKLRWKRFMDLYNLPGDPYAMNEKYLDALVAHAILLPGALEMLVLLRENYNLAATTNGLESVQKRRLVNSGLDHIFEQVIISEEIGVAKPQVAFYETAFAKCGQPEKEEVLMIGDNLHSDIQGAVNYRIDSIWYNPFRQVNKTSIVPTYEVQSLDQMLQLLS